MDNMNLKSDDLYLMETNRVIKGFDISLNCLNSVIDRV